MTAYDYQRPTLEDYVESGRILDLNGDGRYLIWRTYGTRQDKPPISLMFMATWVCARRDHQHDDVFSYEVLKNRFGTTYPFDILSLAGQPLGLTEEGYFLMSENDIRALRLVVACL